MPVAGSSYWNIAHGRSPGESPMDEEGMRTMRNLARNLSWMLKCFEAGKAAGVALPGTLYGNEFVGAATSRPPFCVGIFHKP